MEDAPRSEHTMDASDRLPGIAQMLEKIEEDDGIELCRTIE
jgi:hypothetical protein